MTSKELGYEIEHKYFSPNACFSDLSKGREIPETPSEFRTEFQRDRDRIIHSSAFRRLKHKTQVFIAPEGDHYRTRLTHTLEVSQIARTIARALRLNEDLTEAISLGHDLGHTPFGHAGERALSECMEGGFRHYEQSLRVVDVLEKNGKGLNLTYEVRDGIKCHAHGKEADTLEGRIVKFADKIAYMNHDVDDAVKANILKPSDIPLDIRKGLGEKKSERINTLVKALIDGSKNDIEFKSEYNDLFLQFHDYMYSSVYTNPVAKSQEKKAEEMIKTLYRYFCENPKKLPEEYGQICEKEGSSRAAADYVAGMTDRYSIMIYKELFIPKSWGI